MSRCEFDREALKHTRTHHAHIHAHKKIHMSVHAMNSQNFVNQDELVIESARRCLMVINREIFNPMHFTNDRPGGQEVLGKSQFPRHFVSMYPIGDRRQFPLVVQASSLKSFFFVFRHVVSWVRE